MEKLRSLVEARLAEKAAEGGDPRIAAILENRPVLLVLYFCCIRSASGRMVRNLTIVKMRPRYPTRRCQ